MSKKLYLSNLIIILFAIIFLTPLQFSYADYNSFTVNIPNSQGGYTALVIEKSGNGYTGPRGEYYSEFPSVYQLQAAYGAGAPQQSEDVQREQMLRQQMQQSIERQEEQERAQQKLIDQQIQQNQRQQQEEQEKVQQQLQQTIEQERKQQAQQVQTVSNTLIFKTRDQPNQNHIGDSMGLSILIGIIFLLYFVPGIVAKTRHHKNFTSILLVNIFLGWTFLGWVVALVWSFSHQEKKI